MKKYLLIFIINSFCNEFIFSQTYFSRFYELESVSNPSKNLSHALLTNDSGFVLLNAGTCNFNNDVCGGIHTLDLNGEVMERKLFTGFTYPYFPAFDILSTSDGNYLTSGLDVLPGGSNGDKLRMWMLKLKPNGDTLWLKFYDDTIEEDEDANDILETPQKDGYYLQGDVGQDFNHFYKILIRTDLYGNVVWSKKIKNGLRYMMQGNMILLTSKDKIAMAYESGQGIEYFKTWVTLVDTLGNEIWSKPLLPKTSAPWQTIIQELPSKNLIVLCNADTLIYPDEFPPIPYFYEIDTSGSIVREGHLNSIDKTQIINQMRISMDGNILLAGKYYDHITDKQSNWIAKIDINTWLPIWQRFYALPQNLATNLYGGLIDIIETPWGGLACAGKVQYPDPNTVIGDMDAWVLNLDNEGCLTPNCVDIYTVLADGELVPTEKNAAFAVSPNPMLEEISINRIDTQIKSDVNISIFDAYGKSTIFEKILKGSDNIKIDVNLLPTGMYFVQFSTNNQIIQTQKLIKIK
jgi:hypothetical protein